MKLISQNSIIFYDTCIPAIYGELLSFKNNKVIKHQQKKLK